MAGVARGLLYSAAEQAAADQAATLEHGLGTQPPVAKTSSRAPGRLGDRTMQPNDDYRTNSKLLSALNALGMGQSGVMPGLEALRGDSTLGEIAGFAEKNDVGITQLYNNIPLDLPGDKDEVEIEQTEQTIQGGGGQAMKVFIYRPTIEGNNNLDTVVYTHGGGMVILPTFNPVHDRWCRSLAANGVMVIMPDFRNAWTKEKWYPFPEGLNDNAAAVRWAFNNKDRLKIKNIIVHGESGGGTLACAIALKAKREGWVEEIAGVYALCPGISNMYGASEQWKLDNFPSMVENHGYFLNANAMAFLGYFYTPNDEDSTNPLAWPYYATLEDMKGLPPHVMVMDELDILRDEGMAYARHLANAGVPTKSSVNVGTLHATSLLFRQALPEHHKGVAREVAAFAKDI